MIGKAQPLTPPSKHNIFAISYIANNGVRPGINFALERGIWDKPVFKKKVNWKKDTVEIVKAHQFIIAANSAFIWHQRTSTSMLNTFTIEYRKTDRFRFQYQLGGGPGYIRTFLPNVYELDQSGVMRKRFLSGNGYLTAYTFIGVGRYRKQARALQFYHLRLGVHYWLPYNAFIIPYPTLELRLGFWKKPQSQ